MINLNFFSLITFIIPGIIIFFFRKQISLLLKLYENPNETRKKIINKKKTYLINGLIILLNTSFYLVFEITNKVMPFQNLLILMSINMFYMIGYFDDLKNLSASSKTIFIFVILFLLLISDKSFILSELEFKNLKENVLQLNKLSIPVTIFFIYIFYNFINFSDGVNGIALGLSIFFISVLIYERQYYTNFEIILLLSLTLCLYINLKNISFLGNSGVSVLGILIPILYINDYNLNKSLLCDEIFIIFFIPGIDMTRLVIERLINKKSIAKADLNHLHHLILNKSGKDNCFLIYILLTIIPYVIGKFLNNYTFTILLSIVFYLIVLIFYRRKLY